MIPDPYFSLRELIDEDFVNYYKPSMFIGVPYCDFKCNKEAGTKVCHNLKLVMQRLVRIPVKELIERYLANPITKAIVFGGLEPFYLYRVIYCIFCVIVFIGYGLLIFKCCPL